MRRTTVHDGRRRTGVVLPAGLLVIALAATAGVAQDRVSDTVHNLSASGPGTIRAATEQQVCVFCHASHNTAGVRPLWNREVPLTSYKIYESSTLDAKPGQPTGSSKLCLSCHDGTIALGSVLSRADRIRMAGGDFLPAGLTNLGTDLSDDHPISFAYTASLAGADRQLVSPGSLPREIQLDARSQLQCTSCHDPHSNRLGQFLVLTLRYGELCTACHQMQGWQNAAHRTANAATTDVPEADWPFSAVAENACRSCHRSHTAGSDDHLLIFERGYDNCLSCHDGLIASNIRGELDKVSAHDPRDFAEVHDPAESPLSMKEHVDCVDCHNPHAASAARPAGGYEPLGATLTLVPGVSEAGASVATARYEYEVCFRCHGDAGVQARRAPSRQSQTSNQRLRFGRSSRSYHPVVTAVASQETVSLVPDLAPGTLIRCTDCHNSDTGSRAGGVGPDGPHGSAHRFLLERNYTTRDDTAESEYEYALCYKCHERSSILTDESFPYHRLHVVDSRAPCSACHDPHGITSSIPTQSDHTHLINFDVQIVRPVTSGGQRVFRDLGRYTGSCTLTCHGYQHVEASYGAFAAPAVDSPGTVTPVGARRR